MKVLQLFIRSERTSGSHDDDKPEIRFERIKHHQWIHEVLDDLSRDLPEGAEFVVLTDTNKFQNASIHSVIRTLIEAILLVIVVVYVFLQDIKSTLIPTISIFVSIIGTFAVMSLIGFPSTCLRFFALVLAIGTVVDDAIVVVEAVQAKFDEGYQSPVLAADDAMKGVSSWPF